MADGEYAFAARLRHFRERSGLTQEELAELTASTIIALERGVRGPMPAAMRLCPRGWTRGGRAGRSARRHYDAQNTWATREGGLTHRRADRVDGETEVADAGLMADRSPARASDVGACAIEN